ncbi:MAG: hypothetical protein K2H35_07145, partial [Muribaculaceae bacterium]|nr:hypothetical protein [Muribaculaceae bacterium]
MGELYKYYKALEDAYNSGVLHFENNSDRGHNAEVMLLMLRKANRIGMVCGSMSVFRKSFYEHVKSAYPDEGGILEEKMTEALHQFISDPTKSITVVLENPEGEEFDGFLIPKEDFRSKARMYVLKWDEYMPELGHFSYSQEDERIVRLENDKDSHEALVKIGNWEE